LLTRGGETAVFPPLFLKGKTMLNWKNIIPIRLIDPSFDEAPEIDQFIKYLIAETTYYPTTPVSKDHPIANPYGRGYEF